MPEALRRAPPAGDSQNTKGQEWLFLPLRVLRNLFWRLTEVFDYAARMDGLS